MPEKITSPSNKKIKKIIMLKNKKYRDKYSLFCVENFKIISDGLRGGAGFEELFVAESFIAKNKTEFDKFTKENNIKNFYVIDEKISKKISNLETASGICALYKKKEGKYDSGNPIIYLNEINDPGNLGAILRSALAFGFKNIIMDEKCADLYNFKTINAAKDSFFKLNIIKDSSYNILKKIKKAMPLYCTRMEKAIDVNAIKPEKKYCIIFGNESRGVDKNIQKISDKFVKITIKNIESLNVAAAASIIMHRLAAAID